MVGWREAREARRSKAAESSQQPEQSPQHMGDTYLKQHDAPEDIEYYLCGPPMMAKTVLDLLHSLGVEDQDIRFDNFGG